jgi:proteasome lid subunit RPN8/RPN11
VTGVVPAPNVAPGEDRFEIDPALLLATHRRLRGGADRIIGHYHSHPSGPAAPSARDRASSYTPGLAWLILGLEGGKAQWAAFLHPEDRRAPLDRFEPLILAARA